MSAELVPSGDSEGEFNSGLCPRFRGLPAILMAALLQSLRPASRGLPLFPMPQISLSFLL